MNDSQKPKSSSDEVGSLIAVLIFVFFFLEQKSIKGGLVAGQGGPGIMPGSVESVGKSKNWHQTSFLLKAGFQRTVVALMCLLLTLPSQVDHSEDTLKVYWRYIEDTLRPTVWDIYIQKKAIKPILKFNILKYLFFQHWPH